MEQRALNTIYEAQEAVWRLSNEVRKIKINLDKNYEDELNDIYFKIKEELAKDANKQNLNVLLSYLYKSETICNELGFSGHLLTPIKDCVELLETLI